jgi:acyl carrier protein
VTDKDTIREFIHNDLVRDRGRVIIGPSENLLDANIVDSLGIMKLVPFLEQTFSIKINDDEIIPDNFETIEAIASFVRKKVD